MELILLYHIKSCSTFRGAVRFYRTEGYPKVSKNLRFSRSIVILNLFQNLINALNFIQGYITKFPSIEGCRVATGCSEISKKWELRTEK